MKFVLISIMFMTQVFAAEGPCSNRAKYEAIRRYKAETGTVQGSDGIGHAAVLESTRGRTYTYLITISDNNEDGEYWEVDYKVSIQETNGSCKILNVKKGESR
jgi:hypothetical protein